MGTPQNRWREMHQSERSAIMLCMRSCPQDGVQFTPSINCECAVAQGRRFRGGHVDDPASR